MVSDFFGTLLQELAQTLRIPNLQPDANNSCLIRLKGNLLVQIELDKSGQSLIIGIDLGPIPVGRYRENLFFEALRVNGAPPPHKGTFGYSKQADHLVLFEMLDTHELTGIKVAEKLNPLVEKARVWKEAISKGDIPISVSQISGPSTGIFGLRP